MLSSSHLYVPVASTSRSNGARGGSNIILGPSVSNMRNSEISIENLDQMSMGHNYSQHNDSQTNIPAEVVMRPPRLASPAGHSSLVPPHADGRRSSHSSLPKSRSHSRSHSSSEEPHSVPVARLMSNPSQPQSQYLAVPNQQFHANQSNQNVHSDQPATTRKTKAQSGPRKRRTVTDEFGSDDESEYQSSIPKSRSTNTSRGDSPIKSTFESNSGGKSPIDSEAEEDEECGDENQRRRHRESETRRRGRLRDQFQQLNDLVKCPKKTRAQILNSAVSQLQQYKERIIQLEAQVASRSNNNMNDNEPISNHSNQRSNGYRNKETVLSESESSRGVGRFKDTYSHAVSLPPKRVRSHQNIHDIGMSLHTNLDDGLYDGASSMYTPVLDMNNAFVDNFQGLSRADVPGVINSDQTKVSVLPVVMHHGNSSIASTASMQLECDPAEINRSEPQDPTMAAVVSALRDQLSPLVSIAISQPTPSTSSASFSSLLMDYQNSQNATQPSGDTLVVPTPSNHRRSTSGDQISRSTSPMCDLSRSSSYSSQSSTTQAYVRPPCMPTDSKSTDMPPCMKGPNGNTLKARTCLVTGAPACTPALLSIHHPLISNVAICIIGLDSRYVDCNREFERVAGTARENLNKKNMFERAHPEELHHVMSVFRRMLEGGVSVWESFRRFQTDDPTVYRTVKFTLTSVKIASHPLFFVGFCLPEDVSHVEPIPGVTGFTDDISAQEGKGNGCIYYSPPTSHSHDSLLLSSHSSSSLISNSSSALASSVPSMISNQPNPVFSLTETNLPAPIDLGLNLNTNDGANDGMLHFPLNDYLESLGEDEIEENNLQVFFNEFSPADPITPNPLNYLDVLSNCHPSSNSLSIGLGGDWKTESSVGLEPTSEMNYF